MTQQIVFSNEQFTALLEKLSTVSGNTGEASTSKIANTSFQAAGNCGNFSLCTARFDGSDPSDVDAFLDAALTYKDCLNVSDDNAYRGLSMLLEGTAAKWWQGVKKTIPDWDGAVASLRDVFSRRLPAHLIFRKIFSREQSIKESTEIFVCNLRALISQLPYDVIETMAIDMVYGLFRRDIREKLPRSEFTTFKELLTRARGVEQSLQEVLADAQFDNTTNKADSQELTSKRTLRPRCPYCRTYGHGKDECLKLKSKESKLTPVTTISSGIKCFGCGAPGVLRSKCTNCNAKHPTVLESKYIQFCSTTTDVSVLNKPILGVILNGHYGNCTVDSGSTVSLASYGLYLILLNDGQNFSKRSINICFADGIVHNEEVLSTEVLVTLEHKTVCLTINVLPRAQTKATLLGVDFITSVGLVLDISRNQWYFNDEPAKIFNFCGTSQVNCENVNFVSLREDEGKNLSPAQRQGVEALLKEHSSVFKMGGDPTDFAVHRIKTTKQDPISVPPYPLSSHKKQFLKEEIQRLVSEDIIEECESPWGFPVVLVPKKDGKLRLCVDYRRLNAVTVPDSFPLPRIEQLLHTSKRIMYMSTLDLQSGFLQVPIAEEDRDKTCFVTPFGTYRYLRMGFGLRNAPATFQRLMSRFCSGLGERSVHAYLDDILVISDSYENHISDLRAVFERLKLFKLRARREKCCFLRKSVKYLGHVLTPNGIEVDTDKISAIKNIKVPCCIKDVISFVQTCSWYRKFIPLFSSIARPLTNLLKKNSLFRFGEQELQAFNILKEKLTSAPVLIQSDPNLPFFLQTDSSNFAIGAVLMQGDDNNLRPIEYASRLLTPAEQNYSTVEREALAVIYATEKFRTYLEGAEVNIISDCQPLQWLLTLKTPTGRLARWALKIQGLNMKISYTPGKSNVVADMLSRPGCKNLNGVVEACFVSVEMPKVGAADLRERQLEDPDLYVITKALEGEDNLDMIRWLDRGYVLNNGILYRNNPHEDIEDPQLVVPSSLRQELLNYYHDSATGGHYGVDKTYLKMSGKYYFVGMRRFIADYIKGCIECQRYKACNTKPSGLLQTPAPAQRFETIAVDLFGPLPKTENQNRWILVCEDTASKWVELYALKTATAEACAKTLVEEIFLRFGTPRKMISDNGVQFISDVMQKVTYCFGIDTPFIPMYHPESNPVERKNRDLKTQLSILVQDSHTKWDDHLAAIRFAINSTVCDSTNHTPAYLTFGRELRAPHDTVYDLRAVVDAENFVPRITPYLKGLSHSLCTSQEIMQKKQDARKVKIDKDRLHVNFQVGDQVMLKTRLLSNASKGITSKFAPKRDGPYVISKIVTPTTFELTTATGAAENIGRYHAVDLKRFVPFASSEAGVTTKLPVPVRPKRKRGRPRKVNN